MNVKGFILEDDQGREFVMGCERPYAQGGRFCSGMAAAATDPFTIFRARSSSYRGRGLDGTRRFVHHAPPAMPRPAAYRRARRRGPGNQEPSHEEQRTVTRHE